MSSDNNICAPGTEVPPAPANGDRRPPSPPVRFNSRSPSPRRRRPRTPPSREYPRNYDRDRRRPYSPPRRRNRSRSPDFIRGGGGRDRRSRSTSRGRRDWSPRGPRRRPRTPPIPPPPALTHGQNVPYVPQPLYAEQQYHNQTYNQYVPAYNASAMGFDPNYGTAPMVPNNPYLGAAPYGGPALAPPPPALTQDYIVQQPGWGAAPPPQQAPMKAQDDAVALEVEQQRATLRKQRDDYDKRRGVLRRELKILKEQRLKLASGSGEPASPTTKNFLKENDRLQAQIENKMSTIENVIEMLNNIIAKDQPPGTEKAAKKRRKKAGSDNSGDSSNDDDDSEPEKLKSKVIESMKQRSKAKVEGAVPLDQQINYAFYDPELHWCKACNVFPKTAKDYLNHLHSKEHTEVLKKSNESPWHENNQNVGMPTYAGAPTRRTPIRGLQFFVPATAWYCKLCSIWMGDLHCASLHLKSKSHSDSITKFVEHNPDFEVDWIRDRKNAYDGQQHPEGISTTPISSQPFEGIPLQLNLFGKSRTTSETAASAKEPKKSSAAGKKKKGTGKKEKKASKKKKKRSKDSGSSSSSSSDSDDSSSSSSSSDAAEAERVKALLTLTKRQQEQQTSIRNQMRKMDPESVENDRRPVGREPIARRRDSEDEQQEQRKRRRRLSEDDRIRSRSRSPAFDNRYRDRGRNRSRERQYRRRDSRSRSPSYRGHRRRSRSRSPRRIEKPVVNYPPQFKPRVAEKKAEEKKLRRTPPKKAVPAVTGKKLPFIGRMPVFKKQAGGSVEEAKEKPEQKEVVEVNEKKEEKEGDTANDKEQGGGEEEKPEEEQRLNNDTGNNADDELMPDPEQFERLMENDHRSRQAAAAEQEEILPPGIDESESHLIPKPINDAPVPRRGPLPKDLEEALNIIFPGEKPDGPPEKRPFVVTGHIKDNGTEIITGPEPDDEVSVNTAAMYQAFSAYHQQQETEMMPPLVLEEESDREDREENGGGGVGDEGGFVEAAETEPSSKEVGDVVMMTEGGAPGQPDAVDMDELAMLGIDANDLAAQCV